MKKNLVIAMSIMFFGNSCKKENAIKVYNVAPAPAATAAAVEKPVAAFKINNLVSQDLILEGNIVDFSNTSSNADSYSWDFGNGIVSNEKTPQNISFVPCGGQYTISLVVKNKAGESSYAETFDILCRGRSAHQAGPIKLIHLSTAQIATLTLK